MRRGQGLILAGALLSGQIAGGQLAGIQLAGIQIASAQPIATEEVPAADPGQSWRYTALALAGAGAVALTAGITTYALGVGDEDEIVGARRDEAGLIVGLTQVQAQAMTDNAERRQQRGVILMAVGGALITSAVVVWLMQPEAEAPGPLKLERVPGVRPYGGVMPTAGGGLGGELGLTFDF